MMPDNSEGNVKARPVIVDVVNKPTQQHNNRQNGRRRNGKKKHLSNADFVPSDEMTNNSYTVEMQPVIRAAQEYARRTYALGLLEATSSISKVILNIRSLTPDMNASNFESLMEEIERLKQQAFAACEER